MSLILSTGGARAGKSNFAERLALQFGGEGVCYLATAEPGDDEMRARIAAHRAARPPGWVTVEAPLRAASSLRPLAGAGGVFLLDCLTLLVTNLLLARANSFGEAEVAVESEIAELLEVAALPGVRLLIVSNEVGLGVVPPTPLGRAFRDLLGRANQQVAAEAEAVYFVVSGIPLKIKGAS